MSKSAVNVKGIGGIDTRFSREVARFSEGYNFYTKGAAMFTRPGTSLVLDDFPNGVTAIFQAPLPGEDTLLIIQSGVSVYHYVDSTLTLKYTLTDDAPLQACRFINALLLVNGTDKIKLDIATQVYSSLVVAGDSTIPDLEYLTAWKFRPFGWSPNGSDSHMLKFAGYDENTMIDPTVWPPVFTLNVGGSAGSPIFGVFPAGNHLLVLTETTYTPVYGNTEEDFEVGTAGNTSVLRPGVAETINDLVIWLGKDIAGKAVVYLYSGTEPVQVSEPIQDYLSGLNLSKIFTKAFLNQFWIVDPVDPIAPVGEVPGVDGSTTVYVYDTTEREWYIYRFPFTLSAGTVFGEYLNDDYIYFGSLPNVIKFDPEVSTDIDDNTITTSFTWGPVIEDSRILKPKTIHIIAEPESSFDLDIVQVVDDNPEPSALTLEFSALSPVKQVTKQIKVPRDKGYNLSYRISTTDKINKLNGLTIVYKERGIK